MTTRPSPEIDNVQLVNHALNHLKPELMRIKDILLLQQWKKNKDRSANPLNRYGKKVFSQSDEDGITLEILKRLGIKKGVFAEIGVGNGTENNTLILAALGWKGFWIGNQELTPRYTSPSRTPCKFTYQKEWVTRDNIVDLYDQGIRTIGETSVDLVSLDIDGNDYHVAESMLRRGIAPSLFIVEYNAKFSPPVEWVMPHNPAHRWQGDDYFGASLEAFYRLFNEFGYFLACCNAFTGANAFFIRSIYKDGFRDVPADISEIWVEPRYDLPNWSGHPTSVLTVESILNKLNVD